MRTLTDFQAEESDRNARAYGFEIGRGHEVVEKIHTISEDNPFKDRDWKEKRGLSVLPMVEEQSNLVDHARRELALLGNDQDFDDCIIRAVRSFSEYGHSGGSAAVGIEILHDLLQFKNLSPLTDKRNEWMLVDDNPAVWQSRRCSEAFSNDGGKSYYLLSERELGAQTLHYSMHREEPEVGQDG